MTKRARLLRRIAALTALAAAPLLVLALGYAAYVYAGVLAGGEETGTRSGTGVSAPVTIVRDARGVPHVRAANERDLFFADGYLQGSDRLFQMDLYRRAVAGRLAEVFGESALASDEAARVIDVDGIVDAQLAALSPGARAQLDAFARGVDAAERDRPLPAEFRVLAYAPRPWAARDCLVASLATVLALTETWDDVALRADVAQLSGPATRDALYPLTDPAYDAPTVPGPGARIAPVAPLSALGVPYPHASPLEVAAAVADARLGLGSNAFVAGAARTTGGSLLANDPHLALRMPGTWWLSDLAAPGYHAAGATLPGVPGVVLGHGDHVAWGATNGTVTTVSVYRERFASATSDAYVVRGRTLHAAHRRETFAVRFSRPVERDYLRTVHGFVFSDRGAVKLAARWTADVDRRSGYEAFGALARARDAAGALEALRRYPGPPQNFALADDGGRAAYVLAGEIPDDPLWGRDAHDGTLGEPAPPLVRYDALPRDAPGPRTIAFTANARVYGAGYPYRLSAAFAPPYRAARIGALLRGGRLDAARFAAIQADVLSLPERELAHAAGAAVARARPPEGPLRRAGAALAGFDGRFAGGSATATLASALRVVAVDRLVRAHLRPDVGHAYLAAAGGEALVALLRSLRERPRGWVPGDDYDAFLTAAVGDALTALAYRGGSAVPWSDAGAVTARSALALVGVAAFDGTPFPGDGDAYTVHAQGRVVSQSFRAVWIPGRWDAGSIALPQGESGLPGSAHYRDGVGPWLAGAAQPLPFGAAAAAAGAHANLNLRP